MNDSELNLQAVTIFKKAALYIRTYGWQVTGMGTYGLPRCSMGALASAHETKKWNINLSKLMYRKLYEELNGLTLTEFNYKHSNGDSVAVLYECVASQMFLDVKSSAL
jgi:hypothetical protein